MSAFADCGRAVAHVRGAGRRAFAFRDRCRLVQIIDAVFDQNAKSVAVTLLPMDQPSSGVCAVSLSAYRSAMSLRGIETQGALGPTLGWLGALELNDQTTCPREWRLARGSGNGAEPPQAARLAKEVRAMKSRPNRFPVFAKAFLAASLLARKNSLLALPCRDIERAARVRCCDNLHAAIRRGCTARHGVHLAPLLISAPTTIPIQYMGHRDAAMPARRRPSSIRSSAVALRQ